MDFIKLAFVGICRNLKTDPSSSVFYFVILIKPLRCLEVVGTEPRRGAKIKRDKKVSFYFLRYNICYNINIMKKIFYRSKKNWKNILIGFLIILILILSYFLFFKNNQKVDQKTITNTLFPRLVSYGENTKDPNTLSREYFKQSCREEMESKNLEKYKKCTDEIFNDLVENYTDKVNDLIKYNKIILDNLDKSLSVYKNHEAINEYIFDISNIKIDLAIKTCTIDMQRYEEEIKDNNEQLVCIFENILSLDEDISKLGKVFIDGFLGANIIPVEKQNKEYKELLKNFKENRY